MTLNPVSADGISAIGGTWDSDGGLGRIAVYYHSETPPTLGFIPDYIQKQDTPDTLFSYDYETGNLTGAGTQIPAGHPAQFPPVPITNPASL